MRKKDRTSSGFDKGSMEESGLEELKDHENRKERMKEKRESN